jgi:hypothetical protein
MVPEKIIIKCIRFWFIIAILRYAYRFLISVAEENLSEAEESEKVGLSSSFARLIPLFVKFNY